MYFEVDTEKYDAGELGVDFIRSAEKVAEEHETFEFLTSAFGAMTLKEQDDFLNFASAYHKFKKDFDSRGKE